MDKSRSASTCTASSSTPLFLALSTWTSVAVGQTALSMTTLGWFIRITSFSYSSSHSIAGLVLPRTSNRTARAFLATLSVLACSASAHAASRAPRRSI
uniref:Uncharacterized protein n=1 Tax=Arundo donax TaxID=35708 RepID=A0A0A9GB61_ARUDO